MAKDSGASTLLSINPMRCCMSWSGVVAPSYRSLSIERPMARRVVASVAILLGGCCCGRTPSLVHRREVLSAEPFFSSFQFGQQPTFRSRIWLRLSTVSQHFAHDFGHTDEYQMKQTGTSALLAPGWHLSAGRLSRFGLDFRRHRADL